MTLIPFEIDRCPTCGEYTIEITQTQPALIRHGGYGASERQRFQICTYCRTIRLRQTIEIRP